MSSRASPKDYLERIMENNPSKADLVYVVINRFKNDYYAPIKKALDNLNVIS